MQQSRNSGRKAKKKLKTKNKKGGVHELKRKSCYKGYQNVLCFVKMFYRKNMNNSSECRIVKAAQHELTRSIFLRFLININWCFRNNAINF